MTGQLYAQGDIILEPVEDDIEAERRQGQAIDPDGAIVLGRGELSGHRHAVHGDAKLVRVPLSDIARDVPPILYVGHLVVNAEVAVLIHEEHGAIELPKGLYRVRRQRQFTHARRDRLVAD
jgi:hypothetical protein